MPHDTRVPSVIIALVATIGLGLATSAMVPEIGEALSGGIPPDVGALAIAVYGMAAVAIVVVFVFVWGLVSGVRRIPDLVRPPDRIRSGERDPTAGAISDPTSGGELAVTSTSGQLGISENDRDRTG